MFYYLIAPLKSNAPLLTYSSTHPHKPFEIITIEIRNKQTQGIIIKEASKPNFECKNIQKSPLAWTELQIQLGNFIAQYYCASYGETFGIFHPLGAGDLGRDSTEASRREKAQNNAQESTPKASPKPPTDFHLNPLSPMQQEALEFCQDRALSLLFGDTGSGKTEVYFHLIAQTLRQNQSVLFLMPEISLTPQTEKRLKNAFGDIIALWHSKITTKKKQKILEGLEKGEIKIIAGARSALFLPLQNLGRIIVDEEHDDAYKSQSKPRYNAKDLCIYLSKRSSIKVTLGSATPSLSSYHLAKNENLLFRLKGAFYQSQKQVIFDNDENPLSPKILQNINAVLNQGKQVIIFVPTRANFKTLLCGTCGGSVMCEHCSVALSLHSKKNMMLCHYCGFSMPIPQACPTCQSEDFISRRIGTAQLKIELEEHFPNHSIAIFDKDHASTDKKLKAILNDFRDKKIDILIGTQMISKGHDFHNVALAVILGIDFVLKSADFRCNERAFNLLYQVAGRSGRKEDGSVLIQSLNSPFLADFLGDYEDFLRYELENRIHFYPPFVRLVMLRFEGKDDLLAAEHMTEVLTALRGVLKMGGDSAEFEIVGQGRSSIEKIANIYRYHILLRTTQIAPTLKILRALLQSHKSFEIDVDAIDLC